MDYGPWIIDSHHPLPPKQANWSSIEGEMLQWSFQSPKSEKIL